MPVIKISLTDAQYEALNTMAGSMGISIQDLIRTKVLGEEQMEFTPADAVQRVFAKYQVGDLFTIPELYGEEWSVMRRGVAGVFGKQFFHYVADTCPEKIMCIDRTGRHALYKVVAK